MVIEKICLDRPETVTPTQRPLFPRCYPLALARAAHILPLVGEVSPGLFEFARIELSPFPRGPAKEASGSEHRFDDDSQNANDRTGHKNGERLAHAEPRRIQQIPVDYFRS